MVSDQLTERIIQCAYRVYNEMGFGFLESIYEKCLLIELQKAGLAAEPQQPIHVMYDGHEVGHFSADIVVEKSIILELKSVTTLVKAHEVQLVNYLVATNTNIGLLINFGPKGVPIKRRSKTLPKPLPNNPVNPVNPV